MKRILQSVIPILNNNKTNEKECFLPITGGLSEFIVCPICLPNNEVWYYKELKRNKACGIDRVTVEAYGENLEEKLKTLVDSMKRKQYQPQPVKRVYIPKAGSKEKRGLGIPSTEDKLDAKEDIRKYL